MFAGLGLPSSSSVTVAAASGHQVQLRDTVPSGSRAATEDRIYLDRRVLGRLQPERRRQLDLPGGHLQVNLER